jgi:putative DNA primase/helicase
VEQWWSKWPHAGVGIATGRASRLWVLDLDGDEALEWYRGKCKEHGLTKTVGVRTGRGRHLWWSWPSDDSIVIRNTQALRDGTEKLAGVDVRGDGGYVVAPPTMHRSGVRYELLTDGMYAEAPVEAPTWLLELVREKPKVTKAEPVVPVQAAPEARQSTNAPAPQGLERYAAKALQNAAERIATAPEGDRHGAIFRQAAGLGELVAGGVVDEADAVRACMDAGLALGKSRSEVERTVRDGIEKGKLQPRVPTPRAAPTTAPNGGTYRPTDAGNADRMADRFGDDVRWSEGVQGDGYLIWDGARWAPDTMRQVDRITRLVANDVVAQSDLVDQALRAAMASASDPPTPAEARRISDLRQEARVWSAWSRQTEMVGHLKAMQTVVRERIAVQQERLDADIWTLNTQSGIVDLATGEQRAHDRNAMHTKIAGAAPDGECPTWIAFLTRIMGGDAEMVAFLQRVVGYCLTGSTREQCIFMLYGHGSNGKSTFLDTLRAVLGDYVMHARAETFMRDNRGGGIPNDIAALRGARVVTASEPEQGEQLDESFIKEMTGDAAITARFMRGEFFTFAPRFKVLLATNHRPVIRGTDNGIWRRIRLVPFTETISDAEKDRELPTKLLAERDGILAWAVEGCLAWQRVGLAAPDAVQAATEDYRADMDIVGQFFAASCVPGGWCDNGALYRAFKSWCDDNGERVRTHSWLTRRLQERGYEKKPGNSKGRRWENFSLIEGADDGARLREVRRGW